MAPKQQEAAGDTKTAAGIDQTVFGALTEKDLASVTEGMTDAEREAMAADEDDDEAEPGADAGDDGDADDADAEAGDDEGTDEGADEGADAGEGDEAAQAAAAAAAEAATAEADAAVDADADYMKDGGPAVPDYKMPEKATETLAGLEKKGAEVAQKFDAGDLTAAEFHTESAKVSDAKARLMRAIDNASMAKDMRVSHFSKSVVPKFLSAHPEYDAKKNPVLYRALDNEVRTLQENVGENENYLSPAILRQAHINVSKAFGRTDAAAGQQQQQGKTKVKLPNKAGKPETPPTLARVPAAEAEDIEGGKYARLDRLASKDGIAYEESMQKMSQAERDEYLSR